MGPVRLVMVTPRFWPLVGGAERVFASLAAELTARGVPVTILTAGWNLRWPATVTYRQVPVVRVPRAPRDRWSTFRYLQLLARWLRRHRGEYDLVYVSGLGYEAYAALRAVGRQTPVVVRIDDAADCARQQKTCAGRRMRRLCQTAAALIAPTETIEQDLRAAGYPCSRMHRIACGVSLPPVRCSEAKEAARRSLAEVNAAFRMPPDAPLAVYVGRLEESRHLLSLVEAWRPIVSRWPNARLWLAGSGPYERAMRDRIEARGLSSRVLLAGSFDDVTEFLAAADLFILPGGSRRSPLALLEAMGAGLPIVAADLSDHRESAAHDCEALLVPAGDVEALSAAIFRLLDDPELASRLGTAARTRAAEEFSLGRMVEGHVELMERLVL